MTPKDQVKERISIIDVVATYVRLEKAGNSYKARCPFHQEKSPSFHVSPDRGTYHCFGCQAHGDIFTFVENIEHIPFIDALKMLADRAGVTLGDMRKNKEEARLVSLTNDASIYYEASLKKSAQAREYLLDRGLLSDTIEKFHIGFAVPEWRHLFIHLATLGYSPEEMELAGLEVKTEKGYYDKFRGRIMFPIRNIGGATVGFSGRILPVLIDPSKDQAKYMNSPETPLYHKSKILFGYDTARKMMQEKKEVVVVEGQMDLCMSYQSGVHNTIAVSGTAFTDEHILLIKRFCDRVILSFDQDKAGQEALMKSAKLCLLAGLDVYVVEPLGAEAKDPADIIKSDPALWHRAIEHKVHVIIYVCERIMEKENDERRRMKLFDDLLIPLLRYISSPLDRAHFIRELSSRTGIGTSVLDEATARATSPSESIPKVFIQEPPKINPKEKYLLRVSSYMKWKSILALPEWVPFEVDISAYPEEIIEAEIILFEKAGAEASSMMFTDYVRKLTHMSLEDKISDLKEQVKRGENVSVAVSDIQLLLKKRLEVASKTL